MEDCFDKMFCFRPRDKNGGSDVETQAVKLLLTRDVLDGFELESAIDGALVECMLRGGKVAVWICDEGDARDLQSMKEQEFRVAMSVFAKLGISCQLCSRVSDGLA